MNNNNKKTRLRAPPRSVELVSTLDIIKVNQRLGEQKHYFYVRITLIITDIITLALGIYILANYDYFFTEKYNFKYRRFLLVFIYIYSPSAIGIFIVSFVLSLFVYTIYWCFEKEKIHGAPLYDEKEISLGLGSPQDYKEKLNKTSDSNDNFNTSNNKNSNSDNNLIEDNGKKYLLKSSNKKRNIDDNLNQSNENKRKDSSKEPQIKEEYIGINADKVTLFPYTVTIFVIMTIIFYFVALPLSIILLIKLLKDTIYGDIFDFLSLYIFIFANLVNGILIVIVFFHMFIVKRKENSILKKNMEINESKIRNYRREVAEALKNAK